MNIRYNIINHGMNKNNYKKLCKVAEQHEFESIDEAIDYLLFVEEML